MKILVWGCGERCNYFVTNHYLDLEMIIGFIDNNQDIREYYNK